MTNSDPTPGTSNSSLPLPERQPPPAIEAEILVYLDEICVSKYSIVHGDYVIGRDQTCQVQIEAPGMSRHHARLSFHGYELTIEDLESANGVSVDGIRIQLPTRVRPDQKVGIGSARFDIRLKESSAQMLAAALWDPDLGLAPVHDLLKGAKYRTEDAIGRGGMGVVHKARDMRIRRTVALKSMKMGNQFSREYVLRFVEEAQVTGQLQHPNIVPVYELGIDEQGEAFYTMQFIKGITLEVILRELAEGKLERIKHTTLAGLITIFQKICDAIAFAHSKGVVHRDLKPENVMVGEYGEVLVMDWGLAKRFVHFSEEDAAKDIKANLEHVEAPTMPANSRVFQTMNGLVVGSPPYISPEAARGELDLINHRSDIFVLGSILYAILTLRPPFPGTEFGDLIYQISSGTFAHPATFNSHTKKKQSGVAIPQKGEVPAPITLSHLPGRRVPEGLAAVVMKAMRQDPRKRYQRVEDLQADVAAWQNGFAPKAEHATLYRHIRLWAARHRRNVILTGVLVGVFIAAVLSLFVSLTEERDRATESNMIALRTQAELDKTIQQLQGTAPIYAEQAKRLLLQRRQNEALEAIEKSIEQSPNNPSYRLLRAHILENLLRWQDALEEYSTVLKRKPRDRVARENVSLLKELLATLGEGQAPKKEHFNKLADLMVAQNRLSEAAFIRQKSGPLPFARAFHEMANSSPELARLHESRVLRTRFRKLSDGSYTADLRDLPPMATKAVLASLPTEVNAVILDRSIVTNLSALHGRSIRKISLIGCSGISLSDLKGLPLESLNISHTAVADLSPLVDLPLKDLVMEACEHIESVEPILKIKTLESVVISPMPEDVFLLRDVSTLRFIGLKTPAVPAAEFWLQMDTPAVPQFKK